MVGISFSDFGLKLKKKKNAKRSENGLDFALKSLLYFQFKSDFIAFGAHLGSN